MGAGTLALAGLLWAATTLPPDMIAMKERALSIPINFNPNRRQEIGELFLYSSTDQGNSWALERKARPDEQFFSFSAPNDGVYWFAVVIVDRNGQKDPADLRRVAQSRILKVLIDTQPPVVQLRSAERVGDEITVTWAVQEENPEVNTFRLEYRPARDAQAPWTAVQVMPAPTGKHTFHVGTPGPVIVRLSLEDLAKNTGQAMKTVGDDSGSTVAAYPPSAVAPGPVAPTPSSPSPVTPVSGGTPSGIVPLDPPPITPPHIDPPAPDRPAASPNLAPIATSAGTRDSFTAPPRDPIPSMGNGGAAFPPPPRAELRNIQIINSKQVTFNYNVTRNGPSGIRRAILYMTDNDGQTWQEVGEDRALNFRVTANIPGEGIYGFFLVLESKAGLSKGPPVDGVDQPQKRVEVDVTLPIVNIYEPAPDPTNRDVLLLRWSATDKNLVNNRITLEYAANENGPWTRIADVPNTGQYPWKLNGNLPVRVYLRVTARDLAGNEGIAQTPKPQLIDLTRPEGELTDIAKTTIQMHP